MTVADLKLMMGEAWPYFVIIAVGFLPTEVWRLLAVLLAKDLKEDSDILLWVRMVATVLLAAVVAKFVIAPTGALQGVPLWGRAGSIGVAAALIILFRRSVPAAVLAGEALLVAAWFAAR